MPIVAAGVSVRALAESAARAGFAVTAIDAFGDLDLRAATRTVIVATSANGAYSADRAARLGAAADAEAVVYTSNFENHPRAIATLAGDRPLWGNRPDVVRRVRDARRLGASLRRRGIPAPSTERDDQAVTAWMIKPRRSGGGHRIRTFDNQRGAAPPVPPRGSYLQERIDGVVASAVFVALEGRATLLGVTRQLIGDDAFGASGFRYCGNILWRGAEFPGRSADAFLARVEALVSALVEEFDLVGLNGVDLVVRDGVPYPIEVNPRWTASMELVERACGVSMFAAHVAACRDRTLPGSGFTPLHGASRSYGKAVVFARVDAIVLDSRAWMADADIRDIPSGQQVIRAGHPICTVFADAATEAECRVALEQRAAAIYRRLQPARQHIR